MSTPVGFEPTQGDPIGLDGRRLSHSANVSIPIVPMLTCTRCAMRGQRRDRQRGLWLAHVLAVVWLCAGWRACWLVAVWLRSGWLADFWRRCSLSYRHL